MSSVAIVGAGFVGRGWAIVFARAGWTVKISEPIDAVRTALPRMFSQMIVDLQSAGLTIGSGTLANIEIGETLEAALQGVDLVQENGPEREEVKRALFEQFDRLAPRTAILASSSSAIVASRFSEMLPGRDRCMIGHPVNPPHLVPIVEVCGAPWTSSAAIDRARAIYASVGQVPVTIHREVEGFVLNRLQSVVLAEALRLVSEGIITPQDLDHTIKDGLGLRWAFMGPFETIELNAPGGITDYLSRYGPAFQRIASDPAPPSVWTGTSVERLVAAWGEPPRDELDARRAWRDVRLGALVAHKQSQA